MEIKLRDEQIPIEKVEENIEQIKKDGILTVPLADLNHCYEFRKRYKEEFLTNWESKGICEICGEYANYRFKSKYCMKCYCRKNRNERSKVRAAEEVILKLSELI
jgi:hypothetical protein